MIIKECPAYAVTIFIAGKDVALAEKVCQDYCDQIGLCVTVDMTLYIFTGGQDVGIKVGLINYARFPSSPQEIWGKAEVLADTLCYALRQQSYTIQDNVKSVFYSHRGEESCTSSPTD